MCKSYYSISEVSELVGESHPTLRFWEMEFAKYLQVKRNDKGTRFYTPQNIDTIKNIQYLLRENKVKIEGAKVKLKNVTEVETKRKVAEKLKSIRKELVAIRLELNNNEALYETVVV
jgi:DNA-binding transcriptional MerR regulator